MLTALSAPENQDANITKLSPFVSQRQEKCRCVHSLAGGERMWRDEDAEEALFAYNRRSMAGISLQFSGPTGRRTTLASTWFKNDCSYMMQDHLNS